MEDAKIIDLYWDRDETAITETQAKYGNYCRAIALRITGNMQDMEECVNDTYLGAWNSMPPHRPKFLQAFLGKIARNLSLKKYRDKTAQKRGGGENALAFEEFEEMVGTENTVEEKIAADEIVDQLKHSASSETMDFAHGRLQIAVFKLDERFGRSSGDLSRLA